MALDPGTRLGPYEIGAPLGKGGMGEVYRAKDLRLDRAVAVKILPGHLASDPSSATRFEREARAISALNHPNICTLFDVGEADGVRYLVMELLEGETLEERLQRSRIPLDQALALAAEIASALAQAHRQGVIHRDLKPGNVMLTKAGAKLLDFGLAKEAMDGAPPISSALMTRNSPLTAEGTIVGTWQYMSPEQLEGEEADARSDIFAFGAMLYELVTGRRAFAGKSQASLIASIMGSQPAPASGLEPACPPELDRFLGRCLAKDPDARWHSASDMAAELRFIAGQIRTGAAATGDVSGAPPPGTPVSSGSGASPGWPVSGAMPAPARRSRAPLVVAIVAVAAAAAAGVWIGRAVRPEPELVRAALLPPATTRFDSRYAPAVSPDARSIAFVAADLENVTRLYVKDLADEQARLLEGTEGAAYPFWSPDGRWVGFFANEKLNKIDAGGGPVIPLCEANDGRGGSWSRDGVILFQPRFSEPLFKVPAAGGTPTQVTHLDEERFDLAHRWPLFMPDGRHFLYYVVSTSNPSSSEFSGIYAGSLDSDETRMLLRIDSRMAYATGYLLYKQGATLMAHAFDPETLELRGDPTPLAADVTGGAYSWGGAQFGVSGSEMLVYMSGLGQGETELALLDRSGKTTGQVGESGFYTALRLSHSGNRLVYEIGRDASDLWVHDFDRDVSTRFTFDPASDQSPVWSPDDKRIAFESSRKGIGELWVKDAAGTGEATLLYASGTQLLLSDWSPDGRYLVYAELDRETGFDIWTYSLADSEAKAWLAIPNDQMSIRFSPDGRWLVYASSESGRSEIYVQSFPDSDRARWQISRTGGYSPIWRADGREIVFLGADGATLMSVDVNPGPAPEFGTPQPLFAVAVRSSAGYPIDISGDGRTVFVNSLKEGTQTEPSVNLVLNWPRSLRR